VYATLRGGAFTGDDALEHAAERHSRKIGDLDPGVLDGGHQGMKIALRIRAQLRQVGDLGRLLVHDALSRVSEMHKRRGITLGLTHAPPGWSHQHPERFD
jgi:hypothetical protein